MVPTRHRQTGNVSQESADRSTWLPAQIGIARIFSRAVASVSLPIAAIELAVMFAGSTLLTPMYELYRRAFGFSDLTLTLIYSVYAFGNLTALLLLGRLSDQIGRRWTSLRALVGAALS